MLLSAILAAMQMAAAPQSNDLLREARKAQVRFETIRRANLPWVRSAGTPSRCDARIGRYCYWHDSTDKPAEPEPRAIKEARSVLLAALSKVGRSHPEDGWLAGQRVRYLLEENRYDEALDVTRDCRAEPWWCAALKGLALHEAERYAEADSAYAVALHDMPDPKRCEWLDLRLLLERPVEREFSRASCQERAGLADQLWLLGQPLWSVSGNDFRTEHLARMTMSEALDRSANPHGFTWGSDDTELAIRYGLNTWYSRHRDDLGGLAASPTVTGHGPEPSYQFFPVTGPIGAREVTEERWGFRDPLARTRYAPRHLKRLTALPHQLARFPRGESTLVAVAFRVADSVLAADSTMAWLLTIRAPDDRQPATRDRRAGRSGGRGVLLGMTGRDSVIASIEVRGDSTKRAARARYTVEPLACRDSWCLSDLLLFDGSKAPQEPGLEAALEVAAAEPLFRNRDPIGVFWEVRSGGDAPVPAWLTLTVSSLRVSVTRRIATRLHLAPDLSPVRLRYQTLLRADRPGQLVTVRLPANARGKYRVLLTVEPPRAAPMSAAREIEVLP